jgi:hypothetical protein
MRVVRVSDAGVVRVMSDLIILGNIACERPSTRLGMKRLTLLAKRENVRRTPALWAMLPNYDKALDALGKRIK